MRLIGTLPTEADSKRFCDYLLTRNIAAHAEPGTADWQVWIEHDDNVDAGKAELDQYRLQPTDTRYNASAQASKLRARAKKAAQRRRKNFTDVRTASAFGGRPTPVTVTIIFVTVVLGALMHFGQGDLLFTELNSLPSRLWRALLFHDFTRFFGAYDGRWLMFTSIGHGEIWRLVTPIFIHYGVMHLVFNMMWMYDLGRRVEAVKGSGTLLTIILVVAVLSCSAEAAWTALSPIGDHYSGFGGMSGVVAGLFGYAWMCGYFRPYEKIGTTQYETGLMLGWLVICSFGIVGPIANAAHWGGLLVGMAIGAGPSLTRKLKLLRTK